MSFSPERGFSALQAARQREQTADFKHAYQQRVGVEGTISQASASLGMRFARYIGRSKVHLKHLMTAAALNLSLDFRFANSICNIYYMLSMEIYP